MLPGSGPTELEGASVGLFWGLFCAQAEFANQTRVAGILILDQVPCRIIFDRERICLNLILSSQRRVPYPERDERQEATSVGKRVWRFRSARVNPVFNRAEKGIDHLPIRLEETAQGAGLRKGCSPERRTTCPALFPSCQRKRWRCRPPSACSSGRSVRQPGGVGLVPRPDAEVRDEDAAGHVPAVVASPRGHPNSRKRHPRATGQALLARGSSRSSAIIPPQSVAAASAVHLRRFARRYQRLSSSPPPHACYWAWELSPPPLGRSNPWQ
jgi:hypothetical protein